MNEELNPNSPPSVESIRQHEEAILAANTSIDKAQREWLHKTAREFSIGTSKPRMTMDEIAHKEPNPENWTDKKSLTPGYICHDYLRIYDREWSKWRDEPIRLLEIGLNRGASVKLWLEYFTKAEIHGMDIAQFEDKVGIPNLSRFKFHHGSSFDPYFLQRFLEFEKEQFDIIIDDGCHFSGPIITAFNMLWGHVKTSGYYVIEDISEVLNPESHSPGFQNQVEFAQSLMSGTIMGTRDIDEAFVSKDLVMLKKK